MLENKFQIIAVFMVNLNSFSKSPSNGFTFEMEYDKMSEIPEYKNILLFFNQLHPAILETYTAYSVILYSFLFSNCTNNIRVELYKLITHFQLPFINIIALITLLLRLILKKV